MQSILHKAFSQCNLSTSLCIYASWLTREISFPVSACDVIAHLPVFVRLSSRSEWLSQQDFVRRIVMLQKSDNAMNDSESYIKRVAFIQAYTVLFTQEQDRDITQHY